MVKRNKRSVTSILLALVCVVMLFASTATVVPAQSSGMISYWKFDEGTGATADDSCDENYGTVYGATWTTGQVDNALAFDGVNDYVRVSSSDSLKISGDLTLEAWIHVDPSSPDVTTIMVHFTSGETEDTNALYNIQRYYSRIRYSHEYGAGNDVLLISDPGGIETGVWKLVVVTRDASSKTVTFYVNGASLGSSNSNFGVESDV
ncbi:MAG: LamG-like jellyroll fold domain-containing protein [Promethearchaeota archaeon]